jgi:hypothetical protein
MKKRVSVLTNEECLEVGLLITPGWSQILEELTALGSGQDFPSVVEETSWNKLISQLEAIQQQRGYKPGWLVHNVLSAGKPPYWVLTAVAKIAGFNAKWAARNWVGVFDEYPDLDAIDWERIAQSEPKIPEPLPPPSNKIILKGDRLTSVPACKPALKPRLAESSIIKLIEGKENG